MSVVTALVALLGAAGRAVASSSNVDVKTSVNSTSSNSSNINDHITITVNGLTKTIDQTQTGSNSNLHIEASDVNGVSSITVNGVKESTSSATVSPDSRAPKASPELAEPLPITEDVTFVPTEAHDNPVKTLLDGIGSSLANLFHSIFH